MTSSCPDGGIFIACTCIANHAVIPTGCKACPTGSISSAGDTKCTCSSGKYWANNQQACRTCPLGATSVVDAIRCDCKAGMAWNGSLESCENCKESTYSRVNSTQCISCPKGSTSLKNSSRCNCEAGKFWIDSQESCEYCNDTFTTTRCEACPMNATIPLPSECLSCPPESSTGKEKGVCRCLAGYYWSNSSCQPCQSGFFSDVGANVCTECPEDYGDSSQEAIKFCPGLENIFMSSTNNLIIISSLSAVFIVLAGTLIVIWIRKTREQTSSEKIEEVVMHESKKGHSSDDLENDISKEAEDNEVHDNKCLDV